ncbi:MAG: hypothetical protein ACXV3D_07480 [Halobacteriota archaeon]
MSPQCFKLPGDGSSAPGIGPAASNGYWLAVNPLSKGRHTLRIGGNLPSLSQEIRYTLIVE